MYIGLRVKRPLFLSDCNEILISRQILGGGGGNIQMYIMKICGVGAESFRADTLEAS